MTTCTTRYAKVLLPALPGVPALVRLSEDGQAQDYWVRPLPSDFGLAWRLEEQGRWPTEETRIDVLLENAQDGLCTCEAFCERGDCAHMGGLRALLAAGRLELPAVAHAADCLERGAA